MSIITNPNQKIIIVASEKHDSKNIYGSISRKAESIAARLLNDGTASFMLYVHFALNQDEHRFALSPKALHEELGISEKQYRRAIAKLEKAEYLVRSKSDSNIYTFYELPPQYQNGVSLDLQDETHPQRDISPEVHIPPEVERSIPTEEDVYPPRDRGSTPTGGEGVPPEGERNNTDIINNTNNNTSDNTATNPIISSKDNSECTSTRQEDTEPEPHISPLDKILDKLWEKHDYGRVSISTDDSGDEVIDFQPAFYHIPPLLNGDVQSGLDDENLPF